MWQGRRGNSPPYADFEARFFEGLRPGELTRPTEGSEKEISDMPTYSNTVPPIAIAAGDSYAVINNENPQPALPYKSAKLAH